VIQDESLRGTSSWANALLNRDHTSSPAHVISANTKESEKTANVRNSAPI
jgi:hypothetical protein